MNICITNETIINDDLVTFVIIVDDSSQISIDVYLRNDSVYPFTTIKDTELIQYAINKRTKEIQERTIKETLEE